MTAFTISTETGTRIITSKDDAQRVICATAMVLCSTKEELKYDENLQGLARMFDIDTDEIILTPTTHWMDYPNTYSFK